MRGKIIRGIAGFYYVHDGIKNIYACKARGIFRNRSIKPLVGDNVEFSVLDEADLEGSIDEILPRRSAMIRPAAANVDQVVILFAVSRPEPNLNLLDRFLVMAAWQQIPSVICFSKEDLAEEDRKRALYEIYRDCGSKVRFISTPERQGLEELREILRGKTTVLAGPSGVGKSTLTNYLQPEACMETGELSRKISRGKNTTRHTELFFLEKETFLLDTPGFSTVFLPEMEKEELKTFYPEFAPWEAECRFLGCAHYGEVDCGVRRAVSSGRIPESRYRNYRLLYEELSSRKRY